MSIFDWILFGISVIVFAVGAVFMVHQVFCGLNGTALNDKYVWGMNIQGFSFFSMAGAGVLAVIAMTGILIGPQMAQSSLRIPAAVAFGCLISAQILMAVDLGRPFRALRILLGRNFISPLTLDFLSLLLLIVLAFIYMFGIFTGISAVIILWNWATLFICVLAMIVHTLLFISRVGAGYQSEPFHGAIAIGGSVWAGSAVLLLAFGGSGEAGFFQTVMVIASIFVFVSALGSVLADLLAGNRPHQLVFCGLAFVVLVLLLVNGFIIFASPLLRAATAVLALVALCVEKHQTVLHMQTKPVLPEPYSQFERRLLYRPVLSEWLNLISGLAAVVAITYVIVILRVYIMPWLGIPVL